jgi:multiple sugar transport system ATP-binding protein
MVHVTHDQLEAISLADRIAVMRDGVLQQYDSAAATYRRPANRFVAEFIGDPPMNTLDGRFTRTGGLRFTHAGLELALPSDWPVAEGEGAIGFRPEQVDVSVPPGTPDGLTGVVEVAEHLTRRTLLHIRVGPSVVKAVLRAAPGDRFEVGRPCGVVVAPEAMYAFAADGATVHHPAEEAGR